jgi:hypothetical protein
MPYALSSIAELSSDEPTHTLLPRNAQHSYPDQRTTYLPEHPNLLAESPTTQFTYIPTRTTKSNH